MEKVSIFNVDRLRNLFCGCTFVVGQPFSQESFESSPTPASISDVRDNSENPSTCLACNLNLMSREHQLQHYGCDWHRYNLKLKLNGRSAVTQNEFEDIINEVSSISGSDSENEDILDSSNDDMTKLDKAINAVTIRDMERALSSPAVGKNFRTPKIYMKSANDMIFSFYRCIVPESYTITNNAVTSDLEQSLLKPIKCLVILFSAGHFAACVFDGENPFIHKTFHRYVLRAKQGTVQSVRDNRGNAPKSGGAALRRHNEAVLAGEIQNLLNSWKKEYIDSCSHIFLRTPQYGKSVFYNGKSAPLDRKDSRIKGIPFPTRRPTFSELKRVFKEIFSITIVDENADVSPIGKNESVVNKYLDTTENPVTVPEMNENVVIEGTHEDTDAGFIDTASKKSKRRKQKKKQNEYISEPSLVINQVEMKDNHETIVDELFTVCKMGNLVGLEAILTDYAQAQTDNNISCDSDVIQTRLNQPVTKDHDTLLHIATKSGHRHVMQYLLEHGADPGYKNNQQIVPYQVAPDKTTRDTFRKFMAQYPTRYDYKTAQVPGPLTEDMENERKQKQLEKKKAQRAVKKEKMKEQKAVKAKLDAERLEQERFAALSDREKRAIAAERRFAQQLLLQGTATPNSTVRCWLCGISLLGKIPFEYFDYQFCSIVCLKKHKSLENVNK